MFRTSISRKGTVASTGFRQHCEWFVTQSWSHELINVKSHRAGWHRASKVGSLVELDDGAASKALCFQHSLFE
jgi:hypothetical protein